MDTVNFTNGSNNNCGLTTSDTITTLSSNGYSGTLQTDESATLTVTNGSWDSGTAAGNIVLGNASDNTYGILNVNGGGTANILTDAGGIIATVGTSLVSAVNIFNNGQLTLTGGLTTYDPPTTIGQRSGQQVTTGTLLFSAGLTGSVLVGGGPAGTSLYVLDGALDWFSNNNLRSNPRRPYRSMGPLRGTC